MKYLQSRFPPQKRPFLLAPIFILLSRLPVATSTMPNQNNRACVIQPQFVLYLNNCFRRGWAESALAFIQLFKKAAKSSNSVFGQPARDTGEQLREAEVLIRAGQDGAGREARPDGHPGEDLVSEQKVTNLMTPAPLTSKIE